MGRSLSQLLDLGFRPENLVGVELIEHYLHIARTKVPEGVTWIHGNALDARLPMSGFDIVYQSTVFSSILSAEFRRLLAARMWRLVRPGGGILWYDFTYDNPSNPDVRGVTCEEVRALFPGAKQDGRRVTLAPPLGRFACRFHPKFYGLLNAVPALRTHYLCWIEKPE
jgi:SAM-dependent methyltransferase